MSFFKEWIGSKQSRRMAKYKRRLAAINRLEPSLSHLTDVDLKKKGRFLREQVLGGTSVDSILVEAFALGREASRRILKMRHHDVQIIGGMALHDGLISEMKTGEGKTLVATLPVYLNALTGKGVHVVTVNDYLAERDSQWMGPLYSFLGLSVGLITEHMGGATEDETPLRRAAYSCDVTYGTNHEIAFDYLRDNLATDRDDIVHRGFNYAIVDEVDFLLIDEARTPLIISDSGTEDNRIFKKVEKVVRHLREGDHYQVDLRTRTASLSEKGIETIQKNLKIDNLADLKNIEIYHAVHQSLLAHAVYQKDVDYILDEGSVYIVDEFTGRVSEDKRFASGLHQAIEAKERVRIKMEDRTVAKVTYQTFYGRYSKLAGMTGTAWSERGELLQTYGCDVFKVPTHRPMIRSDLPDIVMNTLSQKHTYIVRYIHKLHQKGCPVLVGTTSVKESEQLSLLLKKSKIAHVVLNAKNHRREAQIIAQAGRKGAVTISTNMAGRGTDILLGGHSKELQDMTAQKVIDKERNEVLASGGLHVIGTSRHESVRIDNQLRGRAGRQGDPGSSQFIVSLDDEIWKKFGRNNIKVVRSMLTEWGYEKGEPIEIPKVQRILRSLQKKVDEENRSIRQDVLKYDLVVHIQRETIYRWRRGLVEDDRFDPDALIDDLVNDLIERHGSQKALAATLKAHFHVPFELPETQQTQEFSQVIKSQVRKLLNHREKLVGCDQLYKVGQWILLDTIDELWVEHLSHLEFVEEGIGLRSYGGQDPLVEWQKTAATMWEDLLRRIRSRALTLWFLLDLDTLLGSGRGAVIKSRR